MLSLFYYKKGHLYEKIRINESARDDIGLIVFWNGYN